MPERFEWRQTPDQLKQAGEKAKKAKEDSIAADKAQELSNMALAHANVSPEKRSEKFVPGHERTYQGEQWVAKYGEHGEELDREGFREFTNEDFTSALKAVEELQELA